MEGEVKSLSTKEFLRALREEHKSIKEEQKELQKISLSSSAKGIDMIKRN